MSGLRGADTTLKVDGGMKKNNLLIQHQADVLDVPVIPQGLRDDLSGRRLHRRAPPGVKQPPRTQNSPQKNVDGTPPLEPPPPPPHTPTSAKRKKKSSPPKRNAKTKPPPPAHHPPPPRPYPGRRGYGPCARVGTAWLQVVTVCAAVGRVRHRVLDDPDEDLLDRLPVAGVAEQHRHARRRGRGPAGRPRPGNGPLPRSS